ncbi:EmrB/QacA subfamily drug resistance transporter [Kribbella sp. VKM Ac-2571]|uniref:MFS transporter n=1 Tax=Kribbella sp. VKM Ac-2571 TaxID=2512222 RepID=UPI00105B9B85|nr:MFS transporter [Kribbella sp. VKM Ac-2571]TDO68513.1 EmrB/QacA subfamily drug resistance transporter [Kribbella sp. VKM Ac-2571]
MPAIRSGNPRVTLAVLATVVASFSMLQSLVSPALPVIQHDLHTTPGTVTWVFTALLLSVSVATPLLGRIGDMVGKERTLFIALGALAIGCLVAALAPNIGVLIAARIFQGVGGAVFPLAFGIIRDEFPAERVPSVVGVVSAIIAAGGGLGIVLAGPIVEWLGWRWLFWIPMAVVAVSTLMVRRYVPESPNRVPGRIDWLAAAFLSGWLIALLLPLSTGRSWGWGSLRTTGLFGLAVVLFAGWITVELRSRNPLIDMRMMRRPAVWTTNLVALLFGAAMFAVYAFVPQFLQIPKAAGFGFGASVTKAGLLMLPMLVTMAVVGSLSGPLAPRFGAKAQVVSGSALSLVAALMFAEFHAAQWQVALSTALFGIGLGLAYAAMTSLIVQNVPREQTGVATGMNANIRTIGGSIGTALASSIITAHIQPSGLPAEAGFTDTFLLLSAFAAAAVVLALAIPSTRRTPIAPLAQPSEEQLAA